MSEVQKVMERLNNRFTSGNSIPVERAVITAEEWEIIELSLRYSELVYEQIRKYAEDENDGV